MILVFGQTGQVATELRALKDVICIGRSEADLSDAKSCRDVIRYFRPRGVINAAAFTSVDLAEDEEDLASIVNGTSPTYMAKACAELCIPLIQISTDYVFSGGGKVPWCATDKVAPINAYGRSKLLGELGVQKSGCVFGILRTSWVFSAHGKNFVKTIIKLSETKDAIPVVRDQVGAPTPARNIALACLKMIKELENYPEKSGVYHFTGLPHASWFDFALEIQKQALLDVKIIPVTSDDFQLRAERPLNSRLDCGSINQEFKLEQPDWRSGLKEVVQQLGYQS